MLLAKHDREASVPDSHAEIHAKHHTGKRHDYESYLSQIVVSKTKKTRCPEYLPQSPRPLLLQATLQNSTAVSYVTVHAAARNKVF